MRQLTYQHEKNGRREIRPHRFVNGAYEYFKPGIFAICFFGEDGDFLTPLFGRYIQGGEVLVEVSI